MVTVCGKDKLVVYFGTGRIFMVVCTYNLNVPTAVCAVCTGTFEAVGCRQMLTNCGRESHYVPLSILACPEWLYGSS